MTADFTTHRTPVLAVACPTCSAPAGGWCKRPSGHKAARFHKARAELADNIFIAQHGADAAIACIDGRWIIDPKGRTAEASGR